MLRGLAAPVIFNVITVLLFGLISAFFVSLLNASTLTTIDFAFPMAFTIGYVAVKVKIKLSTSVKHLLKRNGDGRTTRLAARKLVLTIVLVLVTYDVNFFAVRPLFQLLNTRSGLLPLVRRCVSV